MSYSGNVTKWRGSQPNVLQSGRVDSYVGANNDKTGYSLTAGSYATHVSNNQELTFAHSAGVTTNDQTISAVTRAKSVIHYGGTSTTNAYSSMASPWGTPGGLTFLAFTSTTNVRSECKAALNGDSTANHTPKGTAIVEETV